MTPYVQRVLARCRNLPHSALRAGASDRRFAAELEHRHIPLYLVEIALLLAVLRRAKRAPDAPPLPPIRSLRYIEPILEELQQCPPGPDYLSYLQQETDG